MPALRAFIGRDRRVKTQELIFPPPSTVASSDFPPRALSRFHGIRPVARVEGETDERLALPFALYSD